MAILEISTLSITYPIQRSRTAYHAVRDVSLHVQSGEFVALVGPSGTGKTTLLHAIAGLTAPTEGTIMMDGRPVNGPGRDRAIVFQTPSLLPWRTVLGNAAYGLELHGHGRREAEGRARSFLRLVGLGEFETAYPHELSGGMQQRANLARALAVEPQLLLFDEPLSALDAQTRDRMQSELQRIWLQKPTTSIYVTHQISEALFLADKVVVMSGAPGTITEVIPVNFPRPRRLALQRTAAFRSLEEKIWRCLDADLDFENAGTAAGVPADERP